MCCSADPLLAGINASDGIGYPGVCTGVHPHPFIQLSTPDENLGRSAQALLVQLVDDIFHGIEGQGQQVVQRSVRDA